MFTTAKLLIILICLLILTLTPVFAQIPISYTDSLPLLLRTEPTLEKNLYLVKTISSLVNNKENQKTFLSFINQGIRAALEEKEEKIILREQWRELLKVDIFYPYFKAKEVEEWISEKASVKFFNLKGRPKFENNQIRYTFKVRF